MGLAKVFWGMFISLLGTLPVGTLNVAAMQTILQEGIRNKEIALQIYVSLNAVKKHVFNIYNKRHVSSKAQAMRIAYLRGLI
ncbi:MAG TPA: LuxR C-terminal-related transcriptional regulator [Chitinophagaceae bacterium]|nr:LuxR C-terminal-related transcriptional regulator [Chitinophagaceae bacterium]